MTRRLRVGPGLLVLLSCSMLAAPALGGVELETDERYLDTTHLLLDDTTAEGDWSVFVLFRPVTSTKYCYVFSAAVAAGTSYSACLVGGASDNKGRFNFNWGTPQTLTTANTYTATLGEWNSITWSHSSADFATVVLNGDVANKDSGTLAHTHSGINRIGIGALAWSSAPKGPNGTFSLAHLVIWQGYLLTDADAVALNNGAHPLTIHPSKITAWLPMDGNGPPETRIRGRLGASIDDTVDGTPEKTDSPLLHPFGPRYGSLLDRSPRVLGDVRRFVRCRRGDVGETRREPPSVSRVLALASLLARADGLRGFHEAANYLHQTALRRYGHALAT